MKNNLNIYTKKENVGYTACHVSDILSEKNKSKTTKTYNKKKKMSHTLHAMYQTFAYQQSQTLSIHTLTITVVDLRISSQFITDRI